MYSLQHLTCSSPGIGFLVLIYKLFFFIPNKARTSLVAQLVKNRPAMREPWVKSLGWEDPLEKGKVTHSNILAWRIPWTVQSMRLYSPWGCKELDTTEQLSLTKLIQTQSHLEELLEKYMSSQLMKRFEYYKAILIINICYEFILCLIIIFNSKNITLRLFLATFCKKSSLNEVQCQAHVQITSV